jgi:iron complex outermembrane receptor protein
MRYQHADYTFDQRNGTPAYIGRDPSETVKKGLIRYEYANGSNVYVSAEETFRFLSTDEWYSTWTGLDTTLQNQTGIQYELGWKHSFDDKAQISVVPYWIETDHELFVDPAVSPGYNKNYDEIIRRGIEASGVLDLRSVLGAHFLKNLDLKTDYNYQTAEFQNGAYDGYDVPMVPRNQAGLVLAAEWDSGFGIAVSEKLVGSRYVINDTDNAMPKEKDLFLTDIKLFFTRKDWESFVAVGNVFGRKHNEYAARSTGGSANIEYYPAPERNFMVGVKVKF